MSRDISSVSYKPKNKYYVYYRNAYYLFGSRNNLLYMGTINYRASRGLTSSVSYKFKNYNYDY